MKSGEQFIQEIKRIYSPPGPKDTVVVLPTIIDKLYGTEYYSSTMRAQIVTMIPPGKIVLGLDISDYLNKLYGKTVKMNPHGFMPIWYEDGTELPYWRVLGYNGYIEGNSAERNEEYRSKLIDEGLNVVQRGKMEHCYRVVDYKKNRFNFDELPVQKYAMQEYSSMPGKKCIILQRDVLELMGKPARILLQRDDKTGKYDNIIIKPIIDKPEPSPAEFHYSQTYYAYTIPQKVYSVKGQAQIQLPIPKPKEAAFVRIDSADGKILRDFELVEEIWVFSIEEER